MAIVNVNRARLVEEVHKDYPNLRLPENIADVLIAAVELGAFGLTSSKSRWWLINSGAKPHAVETAYKTCRLLDKKKAPRVRILRSKRGRVPTSPSERRGLLEKERTGLFRHLTVSTTTKKIVANILQLQTDSLMGIRRVMEKGDLQEQIDIYDKVISELERRRAYNQVYDYYWLGFRFLPDKYWLNDSAKKLLERTR